MSASEEKRKSNLAESSGTERSLFEATHFNIWYTSFPSLRMRMHIAKQHMAGMHFCILACHLCRLSRSFQQWLLIILRHCSNKNITFKGANRIKARGHSLFLFLEGPEQFEDETFCRTPRLNNRSPCPKTQKCIETSKKKIITAWTRYVGCIHNSIWFFRLLRLI